MIEAENVWAVMVADSADNVPCGGARVCPLSSFRWKCDSKFGVDSATDTTRSGLNTVTALLAIPYSSSIAGKCSRTGVIDRVERLLVQRHWPNRMGK
jgi:hypothetical protein